MRDGCQGVAKKFKNRPIFEEVRYIFRKNI